MSPFLARGRDIIITENRDLDRSVRNLDFIPETSTLSG